MFIDRILSKTSRLFYSYWNRIRFRLWGIIFGKNFCVYNHVNLYVRKSAKVVIGDNFIFTSGGDYNPITANLQGHIHVDKNAKLVIGNDCGMSSTSLWVKESIILGNNVKVGGGCLIMDNDCHSIDYRIRNGTIRNNDGNSIDYETACSSPIIIEDDVLIGARTIILKGVTIGARSVIGAGSVVSKSIPSDCIAVGNPCEVVKRINLN